MRIFPTGEKDGRAIAFEIENVYVSRKAISQLLKQADGVSNVKLGGHFSSSNDIRIEFQYLGCDYMVWEPFGDNSRYWIGPKNPEESVADAKGLEDIFKSYHPPFYRSLLGDLLTLRIFRRAVDRH
ncbi:hypothetical protein HDE78_002603 [Rhodanobacter sp. K2T2]|uniref:hypothetical protein n=1 Tax=Rhodanobacter sp. K2T2 TaxID=2723085 RepID=UPI0015CCF447|nr:hypothetical protein [Rhodanobacter sp. K2T2]NYE29637.1 hypothetical protein [Rhodanobacter sp. K2T2]